MIEPIFEEISHFVPKSDPAVFFSKSVLICYLISFSVNLGTVNTQRCQYVYACVSV